MAQFPVLNIPKVINAAFDRVGSRGILPASIKNTHLAEGAITSSRLGTYLRFTTDIVFSSTDADTAAWTTGTINWSDGTTTETIVAGNTGNITATTYVYYDGAITGELQTTTTPASAIGDKKILIAIVETGAAGKDCNITTIGAAGLVVSDITTNQITANTLVVGNMASSVSDRFFTDSTRKANIEAWRHASDATLIDGGDIYTGSVTTSQLNFVPVQSTDVIAKINASAEGITIEADNIAISGSTTFSAGYDPTAKVDEVGGNYASAASGARVLVFPDANTGIQVIDDAAADVFKCLVGGANVGDVVIGNYAGNQGAMWDKSGGSFNIKGTVTASAGAIGGWSINATSIYTGTEDHSGYTANTGDLTIYSDGSDASIHAKNFYIDTAGSLTCQSATISGAITATSGSFTGTVSTSNITATGGTIGGWTLSSVAIQSAGVMGMASDVGTFWLLNSAYGYDGVQIQYNAGNPRMYIGNGGAGAASRHFEFNGTNIGFQGINCSLTGEGVFTASNAVITGSITATSGSIAGNLVTSGLNADNITAGTLTGRKFQTHSAAEAGIKIFVSDYGQIASGYIEMWSGAGDAGLIYYHTTDAEFVFEGGDIHTEQINLDRGIDAAGLIRGGGSGPGHAFMIGDDAYLEDINTANTAGVYGVASGTWGYLQTYITAPSSERYKKDVVKIKDKKYSEILEEIKNLEIVTYKLKDSKIEEKTRLGIIAEDAPEQLLSPSGDGIILDEYVNFLAAGLKALAQEVAELRS